MSNKEKLSGDVNIAVNAQYIKDLSFENPRVPYAFFQQEEPKISIDLEISVNVVEGETYEVVLKIKSEAKSEESTLFMIELEYAGIFTIDAANSISTEQKEILLSVNCPNIIFPYARRIVSDLTRDGGYPPLMISPVDFLTLYMQRKEQADNAKTHVIN